MEDSGGNSEVTWSTVEESGEMSDVALRYIPASSPWSHLPEASSPASLWVPKGQSVPGHRRKHRDKNGEISKKTFRNVEIHRESSTAQYMKGRFEE